MSTPKLVVFAGSARKESYNRKLAALAANALRTAGAEVTLVELRELALPLFDQDLEEANGLPLSARDFKATLARADGFLIASPEYNSSITPLLKNAIDWASRTETDDEPDLIAFKGKVAALCAASPGALGGMRGLVTLRSLLGNIGVYLVPEQVTVPSAYDAFDGQGQLKDERKAQQVQNLANALVKLAKQRQA